MTNLPAAIALAKYYVTSCDQIEGGANDNHYYKIARALLELVGKLEVEVLADLMICTAKIKPFPVRSLANECRRDATAIRAHCGLPGEGERG